MFLQQNGCKLFEIISSFSQYQLFNVTLFLRVLLAMGAANFVRPKHADFSIMFSGMVHCGKWLTKKKYLKPKNLEEYSVDYPVI